MSALVIASITVPVGRGGAVKKPPERIGTASRAYSGALRTTFRAQKRNWQITTNLLSDSDANAIETAIALGAAVSCSGDILGGTISCEVEVTSDGAYTPLHGGTFRRVLVLLLREV